MSAATGRAAPDADRLTLGVNPVRLLFSASPWQAAGFLLTYLLVSVVLFSITLTAGVVALALAVTIVAVPLLIGAALVVRGCAICERVRLRQVLAEPVAARYPPPGQAGLWRRAQAMWLAKGTWRELAYLVGLWPLLLGLDAVVFAVWAYLLAGITFPAWYGSVRGLCMGDCGTRSAAGLMIGHFPAGPYGPGAHGVYVDSLPGALVVGAICLVLFLLFNYVLVATARLHGRVARALLRPPADPLEEVRSVLTGPGPLGPITSAEG
jgi:Putative sensor